jgi:thiol:disulfide interchange protein DsbD
MIPIVVGIFGARDEKVTRLRAFALASMYVLGMGATYGLLGVVVAVLGGQFGALLANPWFVVPLVAFYAALASSMFGAFDLNLPAGLQARLSTVGGKGMGGAFAMGLVGGLTAAPCTGPILAGILAFVATTRNVPVGFSLLVTYAVGMGVLFWGIAVFAMSLPKSGKWMESVKAVAGIALLDVGLYFLRPVVPALARWTSPSGKFLGGAIALTLFGVWVGGIHLSFKDRGVDRVRKIAGVVACVMGVMFIVNWVLTPKRPLPWRVDEQAALAEAKQAGAPMLVDFGAEWCLPCKVYENRIFNDPSIHAEIEDRFVPLKFDLTHGDDAALDAQKRWKAESLPTVILLDSKGKEVRRFGEPIPSPDEFLRAVKSIE